MVPVILVLGLVSMAVTRGCKEIGLARDVEELRSTNLGTGLASRIPAEAKMIQYQVRYRPMAKDARFQISEDQFLRWCEKNGWHPEHHERRFSVVDHLPDGGVIDIETGWLYEPKLGDTSVMAAYDKTSGTAYFRFWVMD